MAFTTTDMAALQKQLLEGLRKKCHDREFRTTSNPDRLHHRRGDMLYFDGRGDPLCTAANGMFDLIDRSRGLFERRPIVYLGMNGGTNEISIALLSS